MLLALLKIGFSLDIIIDIVSSKFEVTRWKEQLNEGVSFYQILESDGFDQDVLLIIKLGLDSEEFKVTIEKAINILESKIAKKAEIIELIKYPIMLLVIATFSIGFVTLFLLPQFEQILLSVGATTKSTEIIYGIFRVSPYIIFTVVLLISVCSVIFYRIDYDKKLQLLVRFKPIRKLYVSLYNQIFTISLSNLLQTNLHLSSVISILEKQTDNLLLAREAMKIKEGLEQGKYIADCITKIYYDEQLLYILRVGEESGMLIYYLDSYSKIITAINQNRGKKIVFYIQPIFYLIFGVLILMLYAAIFIPMFSMMDSM